MKCLAGTPAESRGRLQRELEATVKALVGISVRVQVGDPGLYKVM